MQIHNQSFLLLLILKMQLLSLSATTLVLCESLLQLQMRLALFGALSALLVFLSANLFCRSGELCVSPLRNNSFADTAGKRHHCSMVLKARNRTTSWGCVCIHLEQAEEVASCPGLQETKVGRRLYLPAEERCV